MDDVDVIAVVGTCEPERAHYAMRLAAVAGRTLFSAGRLRLSPDPVDEAIALVPWTDRSEGAVVEFPSGTSVLEIIGAMTDEASRCRLSHIVCVADALHLVDDLRRDTYLPRRSLRTPPDPRTTTTEYVARAMLTATQLEYASTVVLVNWEGLATPNLSALMALVSHLSPAARLRLDHGALEAPEARGAYTSAQERAGWLAVLNGEHDPHMTDPRVAALHYEQMRPLHPRRLERLLGRIERGEFGTVIRSAGFCRLATRATIVAEWQHVGCVIAFEPLAFDARADDGAPVADTGTNGETGDAEAPEMLAVGQDLAFFGIDLDAAALTAALDETALTDEEFAAGPAAWGGYADPFPAWAAARHGAE